MASSQMRSLTTGQIEEIERLRLWIDENRQAYDEAIGNLSNPDTARAYLKGIMLKLADAQQFNAMVHPAHLAVAIVSKIQERIAGLVEDLDFLDEFEDRHAEYALRTKQLPD